MTKYVMKNLSPKGVQKLLIEASKLIIKLKPDANYSASSTEGDMGYFARTAIEHYGLTREEHLNDLLNFRMVFEAAISKKYGVKFTYESNEYLADKYRKSVYPKTSKSKVDCLIVLLVNSSLLGLMLPHCLKDMLREKKGDSVPDKASPPIVEPQSVFQR